MPKIMFIPKKEEFISDGLVVYNTQFTLGFFEITLRLLRSDLVGLSQQSIKRLEEKNPHLVQKFVNILTIGQLGWIWFTSNDFTLAEREYKKVIKLLKLGDDVEFTDYGNQHKPLKLSWRGIQFQW